MPRSLRSSTEAGWVAGVDGCRGGWLVVLLEATSGELRVKVEPEFERVVAAPERPLVFAVDMPIGLLEHAETGGRSCDREARRLLGRTAASSVFSPPVRDALRARSYREACRLNRASSTARRALSRQGFGIAPKISEIDEWITPWRQRRVREAHPELAWRALGGGCLLPGKKTAGGREARLELLEQAGFQGIRPLATQPIRGAAADDVLDALVLCWTAGRICHRRAQRLPRRPPRDARGLSMEIWF